MSEFGIFVKSFIVHKRRTLIIQRSNYSGRGNGEWDIPGGALQFGEGPFVCLEREIKEAVGLTVCLDRLLYTVSIQTMLYYLMNTHIFYGLPRNKLLSL